MNTNRRSFIGGIVAGISALFLPKIPSDYVPPMLVPGESFFLCKKCNKLHHDPLGNCWRCHNNKLKDLYISPEALEDIRNWGVKQVDEMTRKEIYNGIF